MVLQPQNPPCFPGIFHCHLLIFPNFSPLGMPSPLKLKVFEVFSLLFENIQGKILSSHMVRDYIISVISMKPLNSFLQSDKLCSF